LVPEKVREYYDVFAEIVVVADAEVVPKWLKPMEKLGKVQVFCRLLERDFSAQRNVARGKTKVPWLFHLDADETLSEDLLADLQLWIAFGERHGLRAIGFPRQDWIDGELTDRFPDYQYRLHRAGEKWIRNVHEVPSCCKNRWRKAWKVPEDGKWFLLHHRSRSCLKARADFYDTIAEGKEP
jgi:hypothetical protein